MNYIVTCQSDGDIWTYGPFATLSEANDFAEKMAQRFPDIEYTATEIFEPSEADYDLVANG